MPGLPVLLGIDRSSSNKVTITWDGPSGYYRLYQSLALTNAKWQAVGTPNLSRMGSVSVIRSNVFFRVSGPSPSYAGAQVCGECHTTIYASESKAPHARALDALHQVGQDKNPSCLPCHTVGYGLPTGFNEKDSKTMYLAGVQCENCHGPAANHAANEADITVRPRVELAAQVCGGCHQVAQHPAYTEWKGTEHATVVEDMSPTNRVSSCGRCHSGSARIELLKGRNPLVTATNDANVAITCAVCHDPHATHVWTNRLSGIVTNPIYGYVITNNQMGRTYTNQLRNPLASTNYYSLSTSTNFNTAYNPNINICAQCHNARGAIWTDGSRPPHHSVQYNMLLGSVGELAAGSSTFLPATHGLLEKQCVTCHMQEKPYSAGPPEVPAVTGHKFQVDTYQACTQCHGTNLASISNFVGFIQDLVLTDEDFSVWQVKALLDQWALTMAPPAIQKYSALAWEYYNAGELSNPNGTLFGPVSNTSDPSKDEQKYIPDKIKKARFNLYLVYYDGSAGVHNGPYALTLLVQARDWVWEELNK